jgi:hypothetical protein
MYHEIMSVKASEWEKLYSHIKVSGDSEQCEHRYQESINIPYIQ